MRSQSGQHTADVWPTALRLQQQRAEALRSRHGRSRRAGCIPASRDERSGAARPAARRRRAAPGARRPRLRRRAALAQPVGAAGLQSLADAARRGANALRSAAPGRPAHRRARCVVGRHASVSAAHARRPLSSAARPVARRPGSGRQRLCALARQGCASSDTAALFAQGSLRKALHAGSRAWICHDLAAGGRLSCLVTLSCGRAPPAQAPWRHYGRHKSCGCERCLARQQ
jgi:hypothetical protein